MTRLALLVCALLAAVAYTAYDRIADDESVTIVRDGRVVQADANTPQREEPRFTVTDGDTIKLSGERKGTRLVGFNTPETYKPRCAKEREWGERATARLKELVASSAVQVEKVACACKPGTHGTNKCNFGRSCGKLYVDGNDVGQILVSEGLAVPFVCGATRCPRMPRPWCN